MGHITRALGIIFATAVCGTFAQSSSFNDLQYAANYLKAEVIVQTNHDIGGTYSMEYKFTNVGRRPILPAKDWSISFHHRNRIVAPSSNAELKVVPAEGCLYVIQPNTLGNYNGIAAGESISLHVEAQGLMLFKSEILPNFAIYASNVAPMDILSTRDGMLSVSLAPQNNSIEDMSQLTSMERMLVWPDVIDEGRVGRKFVIPSPKEVTGTTDSIVDLANSTSWHIYYDASVDDNFRQIFNDTISRILNNTNTTLHQANRTVPNEDMMFIQISEANFAGQSNDAYTLAVRARNETIGVATNFIHISAKDVTGLYNALETLVGILGKFTAIPEIMIRDDARFRVRSVSLDLTKNFFPLPVLKKLVDLCKRYKLNQIVLKLADDHAWRLEVNSTTMDFAELHKFASRRCVDLNNCLPPEFGAGASGTDSSSGYLTAEQFIELLQYAFKKNILIVPQIDYLGGLRSAKLASLRRFKRLESTNQAEANRLFLLAGEKPTAGGELPTDACYEDRALNPCISQTEEFITEMNNYIIYLYHIAQVELIGIHAGGDAGVDLFHRFPECQGMTAVSAKRKMVFLVQKHNTMRATIVNEEAIIDYSTNDCMTPRDASYSIDQSRLVVVFRRDMPGNPDDWNLNQEESDYLFSEIQTTGNATVGFTFDYQRPFPGTRRQITGPWAKPITCANAGWMTLLNPDGFTNLESAYEMDFNEPGDHGKGSYFIINLHRMLTFEPFNQHVSMDLSSDLQPLLPYRLCAIRNCPDYTTAGKENVMGMQLSLDTALIRTEEQLWEMLTPRFMMGSERAWREGSFENLLNPNDISTYENVNITTNRSRGLLLEMTNFLNVFGYKEAEILDTMKINYRIGPIGAAISNGLAAFQPPPYALVIKTDFLGSPVQIRELSGQNPVWQPLFYRDVLGRPAGGYRFSFPVSNQRVELRQASADGTRFGRSIIVQLRAHNLIPKEIPVPLRQNACLNVLHPYETNIEELTTEQWAQVVNNLQTAMADEMGFGQQRIQHLMRVLNEQQQRNMSLAAYTLQDVFSGIEMLLSQTNDVNTLHGIYRMIYDQDRAVIEGRERQLAARYQQWQNRFLNQCPQGQRFRQRQAQRAAQGQGMGMGQGQGQGMGMGQGQGMGMGQGQGQGRGIGLSVPRGGASVRGVEVPSRAAGIPGRGIPGSGPLGRSP